MFDIDREHPDYVVHKAMWTRYRDLYVGGEQFRVKAQNYLIPRQREPRDVYTERLNRVFYENHIGSIVDWYAATLFRTEPGITYEGGDETAKSFFSDLIEDCDRKGTNFSDFFRGQFIESLIGGTSYVLVDFPRAEVRACTRGEEDALGVSRAYLVEYGIDDVINWSLDERGNLEWVVIRTEVTRQNRVEDDQREVETRWAYYDKQNYRIYRRSKTGIGTESDAVLIDEGTHALTKLRQVPLFGLRMSKGLWMLNCAGSLQLEHFNKSNALAWAITMGLFAMPVVYSEKEWNQIVGESYFIQLNPGDKFGWAEPEGRVFQIAAENLTHLKEEIYRVCYLPQAGGSLDRSGGQSALSKQRDFAITQEVLRAYGDSVKDLMRRVLRAIGAAREDTLEINVTGMDEFDIADFAAEVDDAHKLLALGVVSPTLKKEMFKKLALKYLCDVRQDVKGQIADEIDKSQEIEVTRQETNDGG